MVKIGLLNLEMKKVIAMVIKVNYGGKDIIKTGYYGYPWWNYVHKKLKAKHNYSDEQITAFLHLIDTLIRLDLHIEYLWRQRSVK